jgi:hypothetical protein
MGARGWEERRGTRVALAMLVALAATGARGGKDTKVAGWITGFGIVALTFMMVMYALERRHRRFLLLFALGCLLSSAYGFASGAWPFGVVELIWTGIAVNRYRANDDPPVSAESEPGR